MDKLVFTRAGVAYPPPKPGELERLKADSLNKTPGNLNEEDGYNCKKCLNRGYTMKVVEDLGNYYVTSVPCKCMTTRASIRRMKRSGLEKLIAKSKFENFEAPEEWQKKLLRCAKDFAENPEGWFYLGGQSGAGKTFLCTAICRELLLEGKDVLYMLWRDEVARLKSIANTPEYTEELERYKTVEVLYIDDLFKSGHGAGEAQRPTPADQQIAFELLNYRINNDLVTVISSECTASELVDIDEATGGRIAEGKHTYNIGRDRGKNYRLRNIEEI